jgi:hypothetical protein
MFFFKLIFERIGDEFVYVCCYKMDEDNVKKKKRWMKMMNGVQHSHLLDPLSLLL